MPGQNDNTNQKHELPKEISLYLWSSEVFDRYEELLKSVGIGDEKVPDLSALVFELCEEKIKPEEVVSLIESFGIEKEQARSLALQVYSKILLKIANDLPFDVRREMAALGGSGEIAQEVPKKLEAGEYVKAYVAGLPGEAEERLAHRLEGMLLSYVKGSSTREHVKDQMQHSMKLDGLDLEQEVAEDVLGKFDVDRKGKVFVSEDQTPPNPPLVRGGVSTVSTPLPPNHPSPPHPFVADSHEIEQIKLKAARAINTPTLTDVPAVVAAVCDHDAFGFDDPLLNDRCKKIIESRVREVRDASAVRAQLERGVDKGGLGVSGRRLADILERMESIVAKYEDAQKKKHEDEKARSVEDRQKQREAKQEAAKQDESLLDKRFKDIVGAVAIDTTKVRSAIEGAKQTQPKALKVYAPTMQEIAFEKRLTGPVDELKRMTLTEFRRLSRDPAQAATKIKDKVGVLEEQGYDKKIEGVRAWRSSPLNALYLKLTHEALLGGKGIKEVLDAYIGKKEEVLTIDEYHAVMELNSELRF